MYDKIHYKLKKKSHTKKIKIKTNKQQNKLQARIEYLHDFISKVSNYLFSLGYNFCENKIINQFREIQLCF